MSYSNVHFYNNIIYSLPLVKTRFFFLKSFSQLLISGFEKFRTKIILYRVQERVLRQILKPQCASSQKSTALMIRRSEISLQIV
uniref:Uncharacterized protein n=1 Tax=Lepeophtheirus salmonis TaxID=72036 RepID=A0A0K2VFH5_LEPSM